MVVPPPRAFELFLIIVHKRTSTSHREIRCTSSSSFDVRASHPFHRLSRQSPRFVFLFRRRRPLRLRCEERPFDSLPFRHRCHHRRRAERDARRRVTRFERARAFLLVRHHGHRGRRETEEKKRTLEPAPLLFFLSSFFSRRRRRRFHIVRHMYESCVLWVCRFSLEY